VGGSAGSIGGLGCSRPGIRVMFLRGPHGISMELLERDEKYV
jgi:hypothetical protein